MLIRDLLKKSSRSQNGAGIVTVMIAAALVVVAALVVSNFVVDQARISQKIEISGNCQNIANSLVEFIKKDEASLFISSFGASPGTANFPAGLGTTEEGIDRFAFGAGTIPVYTGPASMSITTDRATTLPANFLYYNHLNIKNSTNRLVALASEENFCCGPDLDACPGATYYQNDFAGAATVPRPGFTILEKNVSVDLKVNFQGITCAGGVIPFAQLPDSRDSTLATFKVEVTMNRGLPDQKNCSGSGVVQRTMDTVAPLTLLEYDESTLCSSGQNDPAQCGAAAPVRITVRSFKNNAGSSCTTNCLRNAVVEPNCSIVGNSLFNPITSAGANTCDTDCTQSDPGTLYLCKIGEKSWFNSPGSANFWEPCETAIVRDYDGVTPAGTVSISYNPLNAANASQATANAVITLTNLTSNRSYVTNVRAVDTAGNVGPSFCSYAAGGIGSDSCLSSSPAHFSVINGTPTVSALIDTSDHVDNAGQALGNNTTLTSQVRYSTALSLFNGKYQCQSGGPTFTSNVVYSPALPVGVAPPGTSCTATVTLPSGAVTNLPSGAAPSTNVCDCTTVPGSCVARLSSVATNGNYSVAMSVENACGTLPAIAAVPWCLDSVPTIGATVPTYAVGLTPPANHVNTVTEPAIAAKACGVTSLCPNLDGSFTPSLTGCTSPGGWSPMVDSGCTADPNSNYCVALLDPCGRFQQTINPTSPPPAISYTTHLDSVPYGSAPAANECYIFGGIRRGGSRCEVGSYCSLNGKCFNTCPTSGQACTVAADCEHASYGVVSSQVGGPQCVANRCTCPTNMDTPSATSCASKHCPVLNSCNFNIAPTIPAGGACTSCSHWTVGPWSLCTAGNMTRTVTCNNPFNCCIGPMPASSSTCPDCTAPWGGPVLDGTSITAYQTPTVACAGTCASETRTCTNGVLSGSYTNQNCTVDVCPPAGCPVGQLWQTDMFDTAISCNNLWSCSFFRGTALPHPSTPGGAQIRCYEDGEYPACCTNGTPCSDFQITVLNCQGATTCDFIPRQATCFVADTPITMADGKTTAIDKIKVGDKVLIYDEETGENKISPVTEILHHEPKSQMMYKFDFENGASFTVTAEHLIYTVGEGYVPAVHLYKDFKNKKIQNLMDQDKDPVAIKNVAAYIDSVPTYNIHVEGVSSDLEKYGRNGRGHNYYANGILAHNAKWCCDQFGNNCMSNPPITLPGTNVTCRSDRVSNTLTDNYCDIGTPYTGCLDPGGTASCTQPGVCGAAHGAVLTAPPTTTRCDSGTPSVVSGSNPYTWQCVGAGGTANCASVSGGCSGGLTWQYSYSDTLGQSDAVCAYPLCSSVEGTTGPVAGQSGAEVNCVNSYGACCGDATVCAGNYRAYTCQGAACSDFVQIACFVEGTKVTLASGDKRNIEDLSVGDFVKTYDEVSGSVTTSPVSEVFHHEESLSELYNFKFSNGEEVTSNDVHLIYSLNAKNYLPAKEIYANFMRGEQTRLITDENKTVEVMDIKKSVETVKLYNIHVRSAHDTENSTSRIGHNYFANGVLVHNEKAWSTICSMIGLTYISGCTAEDPTWGCCEPGPYQFDALKCQNAGGLVVIDVSYPRHVNCEELSSNNSCAGVCGTANGVATSSAPSGASLCNGGMATAVAGTGPWTWTCNGFYSSQNCSAPQTAIVCGVKEIEPSFYSPQVNGPVTCASWEGQACIASGPGAFIPAPCCAMGAAPCPTFAQARCAPGGSSLVAGVCTLPTNSCSATLPCTDGVQCTLTTGTPTSANQAWVLNAPNCGYTCINGYSGANCGTGPSLGCPCEYYQGGGFKPVVYVGTMAECLAMRPNYNPKYTCETGSFQFPADPTCIALVDMTDIWHMTNPTPMCDPYVGPTYGWFTGVWGACSGVGGTRTRTVECRDNNLNLVADTNCNAAAKPSTSDTAGCVCTHVTRMATCFVADTPITMENGETKAIDKIEVGDKVLIYDEASGAKKTSPVTEILHHEAKSQTMYKFEFENGKGFTVTAEHLIYTASEGYVPAMSLYENFKNKKIQYVVDENSSSVGIKNITAYIDSVPTYNIHVKGISDDLKKYGSIGRGHNYFANGIVAHNIKACSGIAPQRWPGTGRNCMAVEIVPFPNYDVDFCDPSGPYEGCQGDVSTCVLNANGVCGASSGTCTSGDPTEVTGGTWTCQGLGTGTNSPLCAASCPASGTYWEYGAYPNGGVCLTDQAPICGGASTPYCLHCDDSLDLTRTATCKDSGGTTISSTCCTAANGAANDTIPCSNCGCGPAPPNDPVCP